MIFDACFKASKYVSTCVSFKFIEEKSLILLFQEFCSITEDFAPHFLPRVKFLLFLESCLKFFLPPSRLPVFNLRNDAFVSSISDMQSQMFFWYKRFLIPNIISCIKIYCITDQFLNWKFAMREKQFHPKSLPLQNPFDSILDRIKLHHYLPL